MKKKYQSEVKTPAIQTYDKLARVVSKGALLVAMPTIIGLDTAIQVMEGTNLNKSMANVKKEIKTRLNKGEGRGRHMAGINY